MRAFFVCFDNRVAFIPIGIGMLYFSSNVMEKEIDYTNCKNDQNVPCSQVQ